MAKVMLRCLKSWKGCSGGDQQSIAGFSGTGGDTHFGKQEAALRCSWSSRGSCGSDAIAVFVGISGTG